jgi:hypothetical protein
MCVNTLSPGSESDTACSQPNRTPKRQEPRLCSQGFLGSHRGPIESAPGLNNGGFALANRRLAYAASKPKGENYTTHGSQQFSHGAPLQNAQVSIVIIPEFLTSAERPHFPNNLARSLTGGNLLRMLPASGSYRLDSRLILKEFGWLSGGYFECVNCC